MTNQHSIILAMVQQGSVIKYEHLLRPEYFNDFYGEVYGALRTYELQFKKCMSAETFQYQWPDFEWIDIPQDVEWFADEVGQDFVSAKLMKLIEEMPEHVQANPREAARAMQAKLSEFLPYLSENVGETVGLVQHLLVRAQIARERRVVDNQISGITTGMKQIDEMTHGTQRGEIELYCARPGNGKTLMLLNSCYRAWLDQGKRVSFISPEMTAYELGIRLDALHLHFSAMKLQSGRMTDEEIANYIDSGSAWKSEVAGDILFRESYGIGRRFTTADIRAIIDRDNSDLVALDGLLLVDPVQPFRDTRTRLSNLMEEIKKITVETGVPIRAAHQINRETEKNVSAKRKKDTPPDEQLPELFHLAESGATEQYANKVFTMKMFKETGRMYWAIRKNRNAPEGRIFSFAYDIDRGYMSDFRLEGYEAGRDPVQQTFDTSDDEEFAF